MIQLIILIACIGIGFTAGFVAAAMCISLRKFIPVLPLLLCLAGAAMAETPATELHAAVVDLQHLPAQDQPHSRYLSLYSIPPEARAKAYKVVCYTLNSLSRQRTIAAPVKVTETLLRLDTRWYADNAGLSEWELAWGGLAANDPYWNLQTQILYGGKLQTVVVAGAWVDQADATYLRTYSDSQGAILRADYFVANATKQPAYYAFVGVSPKEDDWLKSLGVDQKTIDILHANLGANLKDSGITSKPRRTQFDGGPLGGVYRTLDVATVDASHDPLRRIVSNGQFAFQYEAGEWFAMGPNGFWRTALFDSSGKRQDAVPAAIATDSIASDQHAPDTQVVPMVSCYRCHVESGLRPFSDDQTKAFKSGHINLLSYDYETIQRAKDFYNEPRLQRQMEFDRKTFAAAVKECTGWEPEAAADNFAAMVKAYAYDAVDYAQLQRDCGIPANISLGIMYAAHDINILELIEGRTTKRGLYEPAFAEAITISEQWRNRK